jgi:hypothetical protein
MYKVTAVAFGDEPHEKPAGEFPTLQEATSQQEALVAQGKAYAMIRGDGPDGPVADGYDVEQGHWDIPTRFR